MKKRILSLGFVTAFVLSLCCVGASAAEVRASTTLFLYSASASSGDSTGEVKINYDVQASKIADQVGISTIKIYRSNGTYVTTITGTTQNGLIDTGTSRHKSKYVYKGISGTSYYAAVTVFATVGSDSDDRTVTTDIVTAP